MPLNAIASAREILTGLHDVMAKRGSAQAKLDHVVDLIAAAMESEVCSIYLLRDKALELFATHGLRKEAVHVTRLSLGEGLVGTIAEEGRVLNLAEAASHPSFAYRPETGEESFHSFAGVPIIRREQAIGVLAVQHADPRLAITSCRPVNIARAEAIAFSGMNDALSDVVGGCHGVQCECRLCVETMTLAIARDCPIAWRSGCPTQPRNFDVSRSVPLRCPSVPATKVHLQRVARRLQV